MTIIAIDPGEQTGLGIVKGGTVYSETVSCQRGDLWILGAKLLLRKDLLATVLVERIPEQGSFATKHVEDYVLTILEDAVHRISPGEWKPWVKANPLPPSWKQKGQSRHERDALGMIWWWMQTHQEAALPTA